MTHARRAQAASLGGWLQRHPYALPVVILLVGAVFRFYNLNWDNGHTLHPDERFIYEVVSGANGNPPLSWPNSIQQFLDGRDPRGGMALHPGVGSPLNPHDFAYGSLPFYLLAFLAGIASFLGQHLGFLSGWAAANAYGNLPMLGRALSGVLDLVSVALVFILGRRVFGYWAGVVAMALTALTVLDIQLSHFYTVDTVLLPFVLLTLLAAVKMASSPGRRSAYIWGGIVLGAALATKTTALLLVIPLGAGAVLGAWSGSPWPAGGPLVDRLQRHYRAVGPALNKNLQTLLGTLFIAALAFAILEPYGLIDRSLLVANIAQQNTYLVTNNPPFEVPFTIQYAGDTSYVFQIQNMLFWTMGIPLALAAFAGVLWGIVRLLRLRLRADRLVLLLWIVPYFLFVGR
ncbi:MAG: glycosyltransferase family 39 protein, partial [Chloroflexota bacterium]